MMSLSTAFHTTTSVLKVLLLLEVPAESGKGLNDLSMNLSTLVYVSVQHCLGTSYVPYGTYTPLNLECTSSSCNHGEYIAELGLYLRISD